MATPEDYAILRADVGESEDTLDDDAAALIWQQAEALYASPLAVYAYTRVLVLRPLVAQAAKETDYRLAEREEKSPYEQLKELLDYWEAKLLAAPQTVAGTTTSGIFFFGVAQGRRGL